MKTLRFLFVIVALLFAGGNVEAQFLKNLGKKMENAAKRAVERKAEQKTESAVDKAVDKVTDPNTYKGDGNEEKGSKTPKASQNNDEGDEEAATSKAPKSATMSWNKFDFVSGDEIIFEDNQVGEQLGEFPSMWDLKSGYAEIAKIDGQNAIYATKATIIMPFMKEKDYLSDVFTIEFDVYIPNGKQPENDVGLNSRYDFNLKNAAGKVVFNFHWYNRYHADNRPTNVGWNWLSGGERNSGEQEYQFKHNDFNHISISFNKRAMKVYLNETRVVNIPRCDAPTKFEVYFYQGEKENRFIKCVRIAKGAVPLYDRMMSDGKFITYGITFDVGKSTIKPESMGEINRIVKLMTDNPDLKFSVEGHTDSTGNAASNLKLSDERSAAVVAKLVDLGIAKDRLQSAGKGQASPIADNATDEGRAKNRRVEFIKI